MLAGVARDDRGMANGSMGLDAADFNRIGLAVASSSPTTRTNCRRCTATTTTGTTAQFIYDTLPAASPAIGGSYVSWGTGFFDYDLDGWDDIADRQRPRHPLPDRRSTAGRSRCCCATRRASSSRPRFKAGRYFRDPHNARGAAFGDLDNDGKIDVVVSHLNEPVAMLRNVAPVRGRHWVGIELAGEKNRDVVGARVVIETAAGGKSKFAKGGGSYGRPTIAAWSSASGRIQLFSESRSAGRRARRRNSPASSRMPTGA